MNIGLAFQKYSGYYNNIGGVISQTLIHQGTVHNMRGEISMVTTAKERRAMDERVRYDWDVVAGLYNKGYTTKDISAIYGTSSGSIARGLTGIVQKRRRGVPSMQDNPATFTAELNKSLKDDGIYDITQAYYDRVALLFKASYIYTRRAYGDNDSTIASKLGIGSTQLRSVVQSTKDFLQPYESGIVDSGNEYEQDAKRALILRETAKRNQAAFGVATRSIR